MKRIWILDFRFWIGRRGIDAAIAAGRDPYVSKSTSGDPNQPIQNPKSKIQNRKWVNHDKLPPRPALLGANTVEETGLHFYRRGHTGVGHRGKHCDLQRG